LHFFQLEGWLIMRHLKKVLICVVTCLSIAINSARGAVVATTEVNLAPTGGSGAYTPTFAAGGPSSIDILNGKLPSATVGNFALEDSTGVAALTNGSVATAYGTGAAESPHAAYATAGNGSGSGTSVTYGLAGVYNLSSIVFFGGWNDGGRDAQHYTILTSTDAGQNFTPLVTFDNSPGETTPSPVPVSHRVAFTENALPSLATSVTHLRVDFLAVENGYTGYTEIDVFGTQVFVPGDADRDGDVDINDFILISNNFSKVPSSPGLDGDIVVDNIVDVRDFRLWKNSVAPAIAAAIGDFPVPEPTSLLLAVISFTPVARVRRRSS
jgi:hypothetical protein